MRISANVVASNVAPKSLDAKEAPGEVQVKRSKGVGQLNAFLKEAKASLKTKNRHFTIVLGNESADLDSVVSAVMMAYLKSELCPEEVYVPLVNIPRADLELRSDVTWLLEDTGVEREELVFREELDLMELHREGRLNIYLVYQNRLPKMLEQLKEDVIGVLDHHVDERGFLDVAERRVDLVGSCTSLVAEMIAEKEPRLLANDSICKLMLGAILADTVCLDWETGRTTDLDEQMAALLLRGAGSMGAQGLFGILREMKCNQESLRTYDALRRDYKQWTLGDVEVGMSSTNLPIERLVDRADFGSDLGHFMENKKIDCLVIMPSFVDEAQVFRRQLILIPSRRYVPNISTLSHYLVAEERGLQLQEKVCDGLPRGSCNYQQHNVKASRKSLQPILQDFYARHASKVDS